MVENQQSRHDKLSLHKSWKNHGKIMEKSRRNHEEIMHGHDIKFGWKSRSRSRQIITFLVDGKPWYGTRGATEMTVHRLQRNHSCQNKFHPKSNGDVKIHPGGKTKIENKVNSYSQFGLKFDNNGLVGNRRQCGVICKM